MLEYMKCLQDEDYDALFFLPGPHEDTVHLEGALYKEPGESIGSTDIGKAYHVILFQENEDTGELYNIDKFEAIFADPLEYMSGLLPSKIFGMMCKKTTTSNSFIEKTFDKLTNS